MTDRAETRRASRRAVLAMFAVVTVLVLGGVWLGQAADRASAVGAAPKTAAAQKSRPAETQRLEQSHRTADAKSAAPVELPGVRDCGAGEPVLEPRIITLACADAGAVASDIKWEHYGADGADGSGVVLVSGGAKGVAPASFPATFHLYGAKNVDGKKAFTGLDVEYLGATPSGDSTETYTIA
ncbi:hypothetical protein ACFU99_33915 [Streptomyces sp. NPDC057654]|uniref:hypothetical protein n=1 Tax=Streptomyces sp. NPDC057654 TaxID=3346196 RepID=UPI0036C0E5F2